MSLASAPILCEPLLQHLCRHSTVAYLSIKQNDLVLTLFEPQITGSDHTIRKHYPQVCGVLKSPPKIFIRALDFNQNLGSN